MAVLPAHLIIASSTRPTVQVHYRHTIRLPVLLDTQLVHIRDGEELGLVRLRAVEIGPRSACGGGGPSWAICYGPRLSQP